MERSAAAAATATATADGADRDARRAQTCSLSALSRSDGRMQRFSPSDLVSTPSRAMGMSASLEDRTRRFLCQFMSDVGESLKLSVLSIATACTHLHHFFMYFPITYFDKYEVSAACLWLAGKVEEQRDKVQNVCEAVYYHKYKKKLSRESTQYREMNTRVLNYEVLLLQCIGFNFRALHPYSFCRDMVKKLFVDSAADVSKWAYRFLNDSMKTTMCLVYSPQKIAIACIHMAVLWRNRDCRRSRQSLQTPDPSLEDIVLDKMWFTEFAPDTTMQELTEICDVLLSALESPSGPTSSRKRTKRDHTPHQSSGSARDSRAREKAAGCPPPPPSSKRHMVSDHRSPAPTSSTASTKPSSPPSSRC